jgi:hypothetical protein
MAATTGVGAGKRPREKRSSGYVAQSKPGSGIRLIILDPAHFHAALVQKEMYAGVSPRVAVYAPLGFDLTEHLARVARFNQRPADPTSWSLDIHTGPDFLERMVKERPGNVVVLSGRNRAKIDHLERSIECGLHVLADKPWILNPGDVSTIGRVIDLAEKKGLVAYGKVPQRRASNWRERRTQGEPVLIRVGSALMVKNLNPIDRGGIEGL